MPVSRDHRGRRLSALGLVCPLRFSGSDPCRPPALVDCNNFYASCERVFQPGLRGRPVVLLSNNDGFCNRTVRLKLISDAAPYHGMATIDPRTNPLSREGVLRGRAHLEI
ncbi:Y-family DNA polymerase [Lichenifustis flavocetrariae]|uniref:Y-family DNA polymerase n=1 Tax=Lichenifustis flavocetrariae TaxID=2949735 RepID=UPI003D0C4DF6